MGRSKLVNKQYNSSNSIVWELNFCLTFSVCICMYVVKSGQKKIEKQPNDIIVLMKIFKVFCITLLQQTNFVMVV